MNDANQHTSVEKAIEFIAERYKYRGGAGHVLAEIKVISQRPEEIAGDFEERVEALLHKLRNLYDTDNSLRESQIVTYRESSEAEALEQLLFGLRGDLQHQVRVKSPRNLTGAIAEAIRIEQKTSARRGELGISERARTGTAISVDTLLKDLVTKISALTTERPQSAAVRLTSAKISCDYCKGTSHREEECRKTSYDMKICDYCNIRGYSHGECFALSRAIREGRVNKQTIDNAVVQAPPSIIIRQVESAASSICRIPSLRGSDSLSVSYTTYVKSDTLMCRLKLWYAHAHNWMFLVFLVVFRGANRVSLILNCEIRLDDNVSSRLTIYHD